MSDYRHHKPAEGSPIVNPEGKIIGHWGPDAPAMFGVELRFIPRGAVPVVAHSPDHAPATETCRAHSLWRVYSPPKNSDFSVWFTTATEPGDLSVVPGIIPNTEERRLAGAIRLVLSEVGLMSRRPLLDAQQNSFLESYAAYLEDCAGR
jgi:hypothetical protein